MAWLNMAYGGYLCVAKDWICILLGGSWTFFMEKEISLVDKLVWCHSLAMVAILVIVSYYGCCATWVNENIWDRQCHWRMVPVVHGKSCVHRKNRMHEKFVWLLGTQKKYIEGCAEARFRRQDRCWCRAKNSSRLEFFSFQFGYCQEIWIWVQFLWPVKRLDRYSKLIKKQSNVKLSWGKSETLVV